jgi:membrane protein
MRTELFNRVKNWFWQTHECLDSLLGGGLTILAQTIRSFEEERAVEAAASTAYYAIFSIFPLMIVAVTLGANILEAGEVQQQVLDAVTEAIPVSREFVARNIQRLLLLRGAVQIAALVGFLWSATGVFQTLARNINRAWPEAGRRNFLRRRLVALGIMMAGMGGLLSLSLVSTAVFNLLPQFNVHLWGDVAIYKTSLWKVLSYILPWLFSLVLFLFLYYWVPNTKVRWLESFWGALIAASAWRATTIGFAWYLSSGWANYDLVYGSLGAIVALMFWVYISSLIVLFGAHLSAAVARCKRIEQCEVGEANREKRSRSG